MVIKIPKIRSLDDERLTKQQIKKLLELKEKQLEETKAYHKDVRRTTAAAIASAFSFVIALFWRDAIQDLISKLLEHMGLSESGYIAKVIAALLVTAIGVYAIMKISRWGEIDPENAFKKI